MVGSIVGILKLVFGEGIAEGFVVGAKDGFLVGTQVNGA